MLKASPGRSGCRGQRFTVSLGAPAAASARPGEVGGIFSTPRDPCRPFPQTIGVVHDGVTFTCRSVCRRPSQEPKNRRADLDALRRLDLQRVRRRQSANSTPPKGTGDF